MKTFTTVGFDRGNPPRMCYHRFEINAHGLMEHYVDDTIRALVPPEGFEAYCHNWPDAARVISAADTQTPDAARVISAADTQTPDAV